MYVYNFEGKCIIGRVSCLSELHRWKREIVVFRIVPVKIRIGRVHGRKARKRGYREG